VVGDSCSALLTSHALASRPWGAQSLDSPSTRQYSARLHREYAIQARALAILVGGILGTTSRDDLEGLAHKDFGSGNAAWPTLPSSRSLEFHSVEACNRPPNSTGSITHLVVTRIPRGIE